MTVLHVLNQTKALEATEPKESSLDVAAVGLHRKVFLFSFEEDKERKLVRIPWKMNSSEKRQICANIKKDLGENYKYFIKKSNYVC